MIGNVGSQTEMRIKMKGLNRVSKKLASGEKVTYYYAWKGGPRLEGAPGTPEFFASYNAAIEQLKRKPKDVLRSVLDAFLSSSDFQNLAARSQTDYRAHARHIDAEFGDMPIRLLADRRARGEFLEWRDRLALKSRRTADYRFAVLARVMSWGFDRGLVPCNPCERPGKVYRAARNDKVWTAQDEADFYAKAPAHLHLALTLALWTGQRQGDLLRLTWAGYDGTHIRVTQQKTGARVIIRAGAPLKAALDARKRELAASPDSLRSVTILTTTRGTPWTSYGFRGVWRKGCVKAGVTGLTFHDLRGTAVTRLAKAGCTVPEIATITGHSLKDVGGILDAHYLNRDADLGESAIRKLEGNILPN